MANLPASIINCLLHRIARGTQGTARCLLRHWSLEICCFHCKHHELREPTGNKSSKPPSGAWIYLALVTAGIPGANEDYVEGLDHGPKVGCPSCEFAIAIAFRFCLFHGQCSDRSSIPAVDTRNEAHDACPHQSPTWRKTMKRLAKPKGEIA